jgi:hypothetical protein
LLVQAQLGPQGEVMTDNTYAKLKVAIGLFLAQAGTSMLVIGIVLSIGRQHDAWVGIYIGMLAMFVGVWITAVEVETMVQYMLVEYMKAVRR